MKDPIYRCWIFEQRGLVWIKGPLEVERSMLMEHIITRVNHRDPKVSVVHHSIAASDENDMQPDFTNYKGLVQ